jgi:hypothetical protein
MLRRVALVRTDVSEELSASFIRVTRIGELGRTLAVTSNRRNLRNIWEDAILHSHCRENLKSYQWFIGPFEILPVCLLSRRWSVTGLLRLFIVSMSFRDRYYLNTGHDHHFVSSKFQYLLSSCRTRWPSTITPTLYEKLTIC